MTALELVSLAPKVPGVAGLNLPGDGAWSGRPRRQIPALLPRP